MSTSTAASPVAQCSPSIASPRALQVGDIGTFFAVDESGSIVKILPEETVDGEGNR
jgi:hypothetical protein